MAEIIRTHNWETSPLGPVEAWPHLLKTAVGIMVGSPVATSLVWGAQFRIFFNDAYVVIVGVCPESIGSRAADGAADIAAIYANVSAGRFVTIQGRPWSMRKESAELSQLTTYYSPLHDETGCVIGVFATTLGPADATVHDAGAVHRSSDAGCRRAEESGRHRPGDHTRELAQANELLRVETAERKQSEAARLRLLRRLVISQEEERRRIARDLHDHLGQQLTGLRLKLAALRNDLGPSADIDKRFAQIDIILTQLDRDIDFLAWELRPAALDELGLTLVLDKYIQEWSRHVGVRAKFQADDLGADRLAPEIEATLYRITQEGLNNIAKHADARSANVSLERHGGSVLLVIEDDGIGLQAGKASETMMGLRGMRERVAVVGGRLEVEPTPGGGTTVMARVPLFQTDVARAAPSDTATEDPSAVAAAPWDKAVRELDSELTTPDLYERLRELQGAVAARDEFIATVAHELRNPITPLMFQIRLAIDKAEQMGDAGAPLSREWIGSQLRRIEQRMHRVLETLDRLLDVSRLSTGRIDLEPEHVDLGASVREVLAAFEAEFAVARCEVRFTERERTTGWWDRVRLDQICRNLISNAIRFGGGQPIEVFVHADEQCAILEVQDHGIGIPRDQQQQIFERFERGGSEKRSGGFGVGLWVVKNVCAAMGGSVTVESAIGRGARFTVLLPKRQDQECGRPEDNT